MPCAGQTAPWVRIPPSPLTYKLAGRLVAYGAAGARHFFLYQMLVYQFLYEAGKLFSVELAAKAHGHFLIHADQS